MGSIDGAVVIVTGASRGIGEACARDIARRGGRVVCTARNDDAIRRVADEIEASGGDAIPVTADISVPADNRRVVDAALAAYGRLDALVANAAIDAPLGLAWEITEDEWRQVIDVDLSGAWWSIQPLLPIFMGQRAGKIVIMSSVAARAGSAIHSPAYAAAKAGLLGLTVGLAAQLEPYGVLVNAITPGSTGTTGTPVTDRERDEYLPSHPLGFGGAQPIVAAVAYLLGEGGDWVSGAVLNVSGGALRGI